VLVIKEFANFANNRGAMEEITPVFHSMIYHCQTSAYVTQGREIQHRRRHRLVILMLKRIARSLQPVFNVIVA